MWDFSLQRFPNPLSLNKVMVGGAGSGEELETGEPFRR